MILKNLSLEYLINLKYFIVDIHKKNSLYNLLTINNDIEKNSKPNIISKNTNELDHVLTKLNNNNLCVLQEPPRIGKTFLIGPLLHL